MPRLTDISANVAAFLDLIAFSEGTSAIPNSDDGYKVLVGATPGSPLIFTSYAAHPQQRTWLPKYGVWSTAAGRYQIIWNTWNACMKALSLPDFSPESQDRAAVLLIKGRKALDLVEAGQIQDAIAHCSGEWASFPGGDYGQHQNPMEGLISVYRTFGGKAA